MLVLLQIPAVSCNLVGVASGKLTHYSIYVRLSSSNQWKVLVSVCLELMIISSPWPASLQVSLRIQVSLLL